MGDTSRIILTLLIYIALINFAYSTNPNHIRNFRHIPPPNPTDWEIGLREATYQALLRERFNSPDLRHQLAHAPITGQPFQASPFGDIAIISRGQLYVSPRGYEFMQGDSQNDCSGCHTGYACECGVWSTDNQRQLVALWTVKRIRHRDEKYGHRYELEYIISPVNQDLRREFSSNNGKLNYGIPGHIFVIKSNSRFVNGHHTNDNIINSTPDDVKWYGNYHISPAHHSTERSLNLQYGAPFAATTPSIYKYVPTYVQETSPTTKRTTTIDYDEFNLYKQLLESISEKTSTTRDHRLVYPTTNVYEGQRTTQYVPVSHPYSHLPELSPSIPSRPHQKPAVTVFVPVGTYSEVTSGTTQKHTYESKRPTHPTPQTTIHYFMPVAEEVSGSTTKTTNIPKPTITVPRKTSPRRPLVQYSDEDEDIDLFGSEPAVAMKQSTAATSKVTYKKKTKRPIIASSEEEDIDIFGNVKPTQPMKHTTEARRPFKTTRHTITTPSTTQIATKPLVGTTLRIQTTSTPTTIHEQALETIKQTTPHFTTQHATTQLMGENTVVVKETTPVMTSKTKLVSRKMTETLSTIPYATTFGQRTTIRERLTTPPTTVEHPTTFYTTLSGDSNKENTLTTQHYTTVNNHESKPGGFITNHPKTAYYVPITKEYFGAAYPTIQTTFPSSITQTPHPITVPVYSIITPLPKQTTKNDFLVDNSGASSSIEDSKKKNKDYNYDDIFGPLMKQQRNGKPFTTTDKMPQIIYSNFYEASTLNPTTALSLSIKEFQTTTANQIKNEDALRKTTVNAPPTSQSYQTSISYQVNKKNGSTETLKNLQFEPTIVAKLSEVLNNKNVKIYMAEMPDSDEDNSIPTTTRSKENTSQVFDTIALQLINNARSIEYLNTENENTKVSPKISKDTSNSNSISGSTKPPKYKRRRYVPKTKKNARKYRASTKTKLTPER